MPGIPRTRPTSPSCDRAVSLLRDARSAPHRTRRLLQQQAVIECLPLADAIANRFRSTAVEFQEIRQVAYLGLTKAVQRFDPDLSDDLAAFAVPTISGEIKQYLRDTSWSVRPPRSMVELALELRGVAADLTQNLGHEPSADEFASATGHSTADIRAAARCHAGRHALSLDATPEVEGGMPPSLRESLVAPVDDFERAELAIMVDRALGTLAPAERRIITLRYVHDLTQREIARIIGVSQMQVSRLLTRILDTLRSQLAPLAPAY